MSELAIKVNNVSKSFKINHERHDNFRAYFWNVFKKKTKTTRFKALENISFEVKKGEFFGIIGRNGSGKSTLLKIISGIYQPNSGSVQVDGRITPFLELGVGFNPNLTARENVYLNGIILGLTHKEVDEKYDEIIAFAEVGEFQDMPLKTFSSGMQVRLAFSIAMQTDTEIFILDEILAVGDANFQAKSLAEFRKLKKKKKTVILVTHDISSIEQYCDRAVYLKDHKVQAIGKTSKVIEEYIYEDRTPTQPGAQIQTEKKETEFIKLKSVEFLDKNNEIKDVFLSGDDLKIRIKFKVKKDIDKPVFGIALHRDDTLLYGDNTLMQKVNNNLTLTKGEHEVEIEIPKIPLLRGNISLTIAVVDEQMEKKYLYENKKYEFNIMTSKAQTGLVDLDAKWRIPTGS